MTEAYRLGFLTKCAEHGVPKHVVEVMLKEAAYKAPTSIETVRNL